MSTSRKGVQETVAARLQALGVKGVLVQMAKNGQILELKCEMPTCYCPDGQEHFDPWPEPRSDPELNKWSPNADHYPTLKRDGGKLKPWNVRLAHKFCNNMDFGWRTRIRTMLEKDPTLLLRRDRRGPEQEEDSAGAPRRGVVDGGACSQGVRLLGPRPRGPGR